MTADTWCRICQNAPGSSAQAWPHMVCPRCAQTVRDNLDRIASAWQHLRETTPPACSQPGSGERPLPGGAARLAYLAPGMTSPTGHLAHIAACLHETATGAEPGQTPVMPRATLPHICEAIRRDLDLGAWADPDIDLHYRTLSSLAALGTELCGWTEQGLWVQCPTPADDGSDCGRRLRVDAADLHATVTCWWCQTDWTTAQLMHRATDSDADNWVDVDAIAGHLGLDASTVRRWVRAGKVQQRGMQVRIADVVAAKDQAIESAHRALVARITQAR